MSRASRRTGQEKSHLQCTFPIRIIADARRLATKGQSLIKRPGRSVGLPDPQDQARPAGGSGTLRDGQNQLGSNASPAIFRPHHKPHQEGAARLMPHGRIAKEPGIGSPGEGPQVGWAVVGRRLGEIPCDERIRPRTGRQRVRLDNCGEVARAAETDVRQKHCPSLFRGPCRWSGSDLVPPR